MLFTPIKPLAWTKKQTIIESDSALHLIKSIIAIENVSFLINFPPMGLYIRYKDASLVVSARNVDYDDVGRTGDLVCNALGFGPGDPDSIQSLCISLCAFSLIGLDQSNHSAVVLCGWPSFILCLLKKGGPLTEYQLYGTNHGPLWKQTVGFHVQLDVLISWTGCDVYVKCLIHLDSEEDITLCLYWGSREYERLTFVDSHEKECYSSG